MERYEKDKCRHYMCIYHKGSYPRYDQGRHKGGHTVEIKGCGTDGMAAEAVHME